jgi:glutamate/tyrosine decarboxylase-like PLP-dependent enzyme
MFMLGPEVRDQLWRQVIGVIEQYIAEVDQLPVSPRLDPTGLRAMLEPFDFEIPLSPEAAVDFAADGLRRYQVHVAHPRYFGLFNPAPSTMGIAADALVAAFNPQLAAWSHSPFAVEVEQHLVRAFGTRFGYEPGAVDGTFTSGGAEANHTALLMALMHTFPSMDRAGVRALPGQPVLYASSESHHSLFKAARLCGLGTDALREVPVNNRLQMDEKALCAAIAEDRAAGLLPFMVAATAGTTTAGIIDPLRSLAELAARERLWFHVDAAWGGAGILVPELRPFLDGIERADSITFDAHKFLSVPMSASMVLTRRRDILDRTFRTQTGYMPREAAGMEVVDPYGHSMQWSRRFIGLKLFLTLAVAGWDGYAETLRNQVALGDRLRRKLRASDWEVINETPLPVVCFRSGRRERGESGVEAADILRAVLASGQAWISTAQIGGRAVLRACITNYRTGPEEVDALVQLLDEAREAGGAEGTG